MNDCKLPTGPHAAGAPKAERSLALGAVLAAAVLFPAPATAASRCFAPTELMARAGEEKPVKGDHRFDATEPARALAPFTPVPTHLRGAIRRVSLRPGTGKLVALTLDLCEQPGEVAGYDGKIFDWLREHEIKATLFAGGKWMRSHEERFRQLAADPLFELANHTSAHRNLRLLSGAQLSAEIEGPQRAYEALRSSTATANQCTAARLAETPPRMALFRFPYGACNAESLTAVNDRGLLAIQWDVSTGDPSPGQSGTAIAAEMTAKVRPGSIIIAHANGRGFHTAEGLPVAIPKLLAQGYKFVTVSELLAAGTPVIAPSCYNAVPGDTDRYDHPLGLKSQSRVIAHGPPATPSSPRATPSATPDAWAPATRREPKPVPKSSWWPWE